MNTEMIACFLESKRLYIFLNRCNQIRRVIKAVQLYLHPRPACKH